MRRPTVLLALLLAACSRKKAPEATPPAPSATASAVRIVADAAPPVLAGPRPTSWTDPRVIDALAADCRFTPAEPAPDPSLVGEPADLFRCKLAYEQSCVFDPCNNAESNCQGECGTTCTSCGATCATGCESCKASCRDDACRKACATTCAACKQECTRSFDRCATGGCARVTAECRKRLAVAMRTCPVVCKKLESCREKCGEDSDCREACATPLDAKRLACEARCTEDGAAACADDCIFTSGCHRAFCDAMGP